MSKLLLIDTFNFLHRAYHAIPNTFRDPEGNPTNAVYGVTSMIINVIDTIHPQYAAAALDGEKPTFRVEDFTGYKAHRRPMDTELSSQIPKVFEILDAFGISKFLVDGYEADDVIATLATKFAGQMIDGEPLDVIIVSNDRDLWQLTGPHVMILLPSTKGETEWLGHKEAHARLGVDPLLIAEYKGLRGDPSDNLPGVFGVGDVTAVKLIKEYGTLEEIYKNLANIQPEGLRKKLENCSDQAFMSRNLARLITDVPFQPVLADCKFSDFNRNDVKTVLERYNFKSLIRRLGFDADEKKPKQAVVLDNQLGLF